MKHKSQHLTEKKCKELLKLLQNIEELFGVTLSTWKPDPVELELE